MRLATGKATMTDPILNYEAKDTYTLVITAEDKENRSKKATVTVTVKLVDLNEAPYFDKESRDKVGFVNADTGTSSVELIDYAENQRTEVVALAAIEPDGADLRWEVRGADAARFEIEDVPDGAGNRDRRKLVFKDQPNYESRKDSDKNNTYDVIVRATEEAAVGDGPAQGGRTDRCGPCNRRRRGRNGDAELAPARGRHHDHGHDHRP